VVDIIYLVSLDTAATAQEPYTHFYSIKAASHYLHIQEKVRPQTCVRHDWLYSIKSCLGYTPSSVYDQQH
jgi:hypothetical protein